MSRLWSRRPSSHSHLPTPQDGKINLTEFVAATMEPRIFCEPRLCRTAFRVLDTDGDGWITQAEVM